MKRPSLTTKLGTAFIFFVAAALVACSNPGKPEFSKQADVGDGVLRIGSTTEVVNWTPINSVSITDMLVMNQAYPSLLQPIVDGTFKPELALSVEPAADGTNVVVKLDPKYVWSDGTPITGDDVKFTLERIRDDKLVSGGAYIGNFASADVNDDHTVTVHMKRPSFSWALDLGQSLRVIPKHIFEKVPNIQELSIENSPEYWVSGGAVTLEKVEAGQRYRLVPNPHYPYRAAGNEAITAVEFQIYSDLNTMQLALQNNDIDLMAPVIPASALGDLKQKPNIKIGSAELSNNLTKLTFNTSNSAFKDPAVRRALAGLVDPEAIVKNVLLGEGDLLVGPLTLPYAEYQPPITLHKSTPEQAKKTLADAGISNLHVNLLCDQGNSNQVKSAQLVKDMLAQADVTVNIKCTERATALAAAKAGEFDLFIHKLNLLASASTTLFLQYDPSNPTGLNYSFNDDPTGSKLLETARFATSEDTYLSAVKAATTHIHEQAYIVALYSERLNSAYNNTRFDGFKPTSIEMTTMLGAESLAGLAPSK